MYLIASSTISGWSANFFTSGKIIRCRRDTARTLQLQKDSQSRFVIGRNLADMGGEDTLHVRFQTAGFEEDTERVADGVDLVFGGGDGRGCIASLVASLVTINSLGRVFRATNPVSDHSHHPIDLMSKLA